MNFNDNCWKIFRRKRDLNLLILYAYHGNELERRKAKLKIKKECPILYDIVKNNKELRLCHKKEIKYKLNFQTLENTTFCESDLPLYGVLSNLFDFNINNKQSRKGVLVLYAKPSYENFQWKCQISHKQGNKYIVLVKFSDKDDSEKFTVKI